MSVQSPSLPSSHLPRQIIVIPVDCEDGHGHSQIRVKIIGIFKVAVLEIDGRIRNKVQVQFSFVETKFSQRAHDLQLGFAGWMIFVEKVTR
jgi:hypothetical protein